MEKAVLITGATGGIGYELAELFASEHNHLVLVARNEQRLLEIKDHFENKYRIIVHILAKDLAEKDAAVDIYHAVAKQNITVDILVNNAGFGDYGEFYAADWQKQYEMIQVNIVALMQMTRLFVPLMIKEGNGKILNMASTAAFQPGPFMSVYYASKAYVLSFSEALSQELAETGVTVTVLCPGPTKTGFEDRASLGQSKLFRTLKVADSKSVARFGYKQLLKGAVVAVHGRQNKWIIAALRIAPRSLVRRIMYRLQNRIDK